MRNLSTGPVRFSFGRGGFETVPITCLMLEGSNPDPSEIREVVAVSVEGQLLSGGAES